jgi:hypothetical protein
MGVAQIRQVVARLGPFLHPATDRSGRNTGRTQQVGGGGAVETAVPQQEQFGAAQIPGQAAGLGPCGEDFERHAARAADVQEVIIGFRAHIQQHHARPGLVEAPDGLFRADGGRGADLQQEPGQRQAARKQDQEGHNDCVAVDL